MLKIKRPALRFFGAKWKIAPWIIQNFPKHDVYIEPFCGGASVLLRKEPSRVEVINDADGNVVNFFKVLREQPLKLKRLIDRTPFARQEMWASASPADDPLESARRFYVRSWQTMHGAPYMGVNGWRFTKKIAKDFRHYSVDDWNDTEKLPSIAERLKNVQIDHDDAIKVIRRFDTKYAFFYVDPPYLASTRADRWRDNGYRYEMNTEEHIALAMLLNDVKGRVIISGYPSPLYEKLYRGWKRIEKNFRTSRSKYSVECLWMRV